MNQDQKIGTLIIIVALSLMGVALLVSVGWGIPGFRLYLVIFTEGKDGPEELIGVQTVYVLAFLVLVAGYGVARYLSVIPPIFRKLKSTEPKKEQ